MRQYIIRAALHDESNEGWVWMNDHVSRAIVCITNSDNNQYVYCQVRKIDENFRKQYNKDGRYKLTSADTIVTSQWYRDALGGFDTTEKDNKTGLVKLDVQPVGCLVQWWGSLRAAAHHPDIVVRLGTRLGIISAWLGLLGIGNSVLQMNIGCKWVVVSVALTVLLALFALGVRACWPPTFGSKIQ